MGRNQLSELDNHRRSVRDKSERGRNPDCISFFRAAQLSGIAVIGSDASAQPELYSLDSTSDGAIVFASKLVGLHHVFLFEVG